MEIAERVAAIDLSLLDGIESHTSDDDRRSLLALHAAAAAAGEFEYLEIGSNLGGSTAHMLDLLAGLDGADVAKVEPIEATTGEIDPASIEPPLYMFIDGEHTVEAALADARWCRSVLGGRPGVIAFHDAWIVHRAIRRFLGDLGDAAFTMVLLPESIVAIELGPPRLLHSAPVRSRTERAAWGYLDSLERWSSYRESNLEEAGGRPLPWPLGRFKLKRR